MLKYFTFFTGIPIATHFLDGLLALPHSYSYSYRVSGISYIAWRVEYLAVLLTLLAGLAI